MATAAVELRLGEPRSRTVSGRGRGRPRDSRVEGAVATAVIGMLVESGYEALTIEGVATRAKVAKTTLYRRWSTKAQLVKHALDMRSYTAGAVADTGSLRGDLLAQLRSITQTFSTPVGQVMIALVSSRGGHHELGEALGEHYAATGRAEMAEILTRAIRRGELRSTIDERSAIDLMLSPLWYRILLWGESLGDRHLAALVDILVTGLSRSDDSTRIGPSGCEDAAVAKR